jgi:hypothetical protein
LRRRVGGFGPALRPGFDVGLLVVARLRVLAWMGLLVWLLAVIRHEGPGRGIRRSVHRLRGALTVGRLHHVGRLVVTVVRAA